MTRLLTQARLLDACEQIVVGGAMVLRPLQIYAAMGEVTGLQDKAYDGTVVSDMDKQAQAGMQQSVPAWLEGTPIILEEDFDGQPFADVLDASSSRFFGAGDPCDGSIPAAGGTFTSTNGMGFMDRRSMRLVAATIASPAGGLVWGATARTATWVRRYNQHTWQPTTGHLPSLVWPGAPDPSDRSGVILLDHESEFRHRHLLTGKSRLVVTDEEAWAIGAALARIGNKKMYGSNLEAQRILAAGGKKHVVQVTLAVGNIWDLLGALLVLRAGGAVQGYKVERLPDGTPWIIKVHPLQLLDIDILISAINRPWLRHAEKTVLDALHALAA